MRALVALAVLLGCASSAAQPARQTEDVLLLLTDEERAAVSTFLPSYAGRRLLSSASHTGPSLERYRRLVPTYEPYLARGDFDLDGRRDLVVTLAGAVTGTDGSDVYLLHPATERPAEWVAGLGWLHEAGFLIRKEDGKVQLGIGSLFSDDAVWLGWNEDTAQMEALASEMMDG